MEETDGYHFPLLFPSHSFLSSHPTFIDLPSKSPILWGYPSSALLEQITGTHARNIYKKKQKKKNGNQILINLLLIVRSLLHNFLIKLCNRSWTLITEKSGNCKPTPETVNQLTRNP